MTSFVNDSAARLAGVRSQTPAAVAARAAGAPFRTECTGGGSTALVATLDDGLTVVLTNEFTTAPDAYGQEVTVCVYAPGQWTDEDGTGQHDPLHDSTMEDVTAVTLSFLVTDVIRIVRSRRAAHVVASAR